MHTRIELCLWSWPLAIGRCERSMRLANRMNTSWTNMENLSFDNTQGESERVCCVCCVYRNGIGLSLSFGRRMKNKTHSVYWDIQTSVQMTHMLDAQNEDEKNKKKATTLCWLHSIENWSGCISTYSWMWLWNSLFYYTTADVDVEAVEAVAPN